ncbi:unnamed protein product [Strongylus vulgaris]|uniref:Uncharacterized protein n=1 Tax=Strongylus vulgaris TaxID=40348 RepID=A0A3P7LCG9_STRVU|nr:unnamed protein product [Strongylus vulgaris]
MFLLMYWMFRFSLSGHFAIAQSLLILLQRVFVLLLISSTSIYHLDIFAYAQRNALYFTFGLRRSAGSERCQIKFCLQQAQIKSLP